MKIQKLKSRVAIVMGSKSDLKVMEEVTGPLIKFNIPFDIKVVSAHRTPEEMVAFAKSAHEKYSVIVAGAGGAAHLPGMIASLTTLPVIGVPVTVTSLKGLDALLSIVQMPKGVPVATVAIDNAHNAGLLAAGIIGCFNVKVKNHLKKLQGEQKKAVKEMNRNLKKNRTATKTK